MSGTLSPVVWFFGSVSIKKTGRALAFFLSSSNINRGKAFAVLSKKLFRRYGCKMIRALVSLMKTVDSKPKIEHVFYITNRMKMFSEH
jgi:hypothetical protein